MTKNANPKLWDPFADGDGGYSSKPLQFFDDFAGTTLNPAKWVGPYDRIMDLVNEEVGGMIPEAVVVNDGLAITSEYVPDGFEIGDSETAPQEVFYSSGQLSTVMLFKYGEVKVRCRMPGGTGLWPLVWLLGYLWQPTQPYTANTPAGVAGWPGGGWCEIDIVEFMSNSRTTNNCAVWFTNAATGNGSAVGGNLNNAADGRFMTWRLRWAKGAINILEWAVDEEDGFGFHVLRTITDPVQIPDVEMYLVLSTAVGGVGGGTPNPATFPQTYNIDTVSIDPTWRPT